MKILDTRHIATLSLLAILGLLSYSNSLHVPFDFDDRFTIVLNEAIHLKNLSFQGLYDAAFLDQGNRPVSNLTFALNYYLGDLNVFGYHLINLAIHLASGMVLYLWIYKTLSLPFFQSRYPPTSIFRIAMMTSLLWLTHPVQTQTVTYIVQRMTGLATLFYLLTLFTYLMGRTGSERHRPIWFILSVGSALMALGSKEIAATLPVVILLYDAFFICALEPVKIRERSFFYLALMASLVLLLGYPLLTRGVDLFTQHYHQQSFTMLERLFTEGRVIVYYLSLLFLPLPSRLTVEYYFPVSQSLINPLSTLFSWTLVLTLITLAIGFARRTPLISFCVLWFFINLAIESSFIMLDLVFEHRLYLPSIGFMILAAAGIEWFISKGHFFSAVARKNVAMGAVMILIVFYCISSWERNWVWNDRVALWSDAARKYPDNPRSHYNLGFAYMERNQFELAFKEINRAVSIRPEYRSKLIPALNKNALYFHKTGRNHDAQTILLGAIQISPDDALSHYNLGFFFLEQGEPKSALKHLEKATQLNPEHSLARNNLGLAYLNLGRFEQAAGMFRGAIRLNPKYEQAYNNLGVTYVQVGLLDKAIDAFNEALRLSPQSREAHYNLARIYEIKGLKSLAHDHSLKGGQISSVPMSPGLSDHSSQSTSE